MTLALNEQTPEQTPAIVPSKAGFHVMAKPSGPACNLDCSYCFYLEKEALFPGPKKMRRMSDEVLEAYVRNTIASTPRGQTVSFTWQGGEPTLLGIDFYRRAVALQQRYGAGRQIDNAFQTNGTLIDDEWAAFLAENRFLVGLSLDGPREIHDRYRRYRSGAPTFDLVMAALGRLQRHGVEHNVLACVDLHSAEEPLTVYRFLKANGVKFMQFTPVVERIAGARDKERGLDLSGPGADASNPDTRMAPFSVRPADWGTYLSAVFEEWSRQDVGEIFVMNFEWTLAALVGAPGVVCVHQPVCGRAVIAEHDGTVYSCDHFVYPEYRLGNVTENSLAAMVDSTRQQAFGQSKLETLPGQCRTCPWLKTCWGGCPKQRFAETADGEPGLNYLCEGYAKYFATATPVLKQVAALLSAGRDASEIMRRPALAPVPA